MPVQLMGTTLQSSDPSEPKTGHSYFALTVLTGRTIRLINGCHAFIFDDKLRFEN